MIWVIDVKSIRSHDDGLSGSLIAEISLVGANSE